MPLTLLYIEAKEINLRKNSIKANYLSSPATNFCVSSHVKLVEIPSGHDIALIVKMILVCALAFNVCSLGH